MKRGHFLTPKGYAALALLLCLVVISFSRDAGLFLILAMFGLGALSCIWERVTRDGRR